LDRFPTGHSRALRNTDLEEETQEKLLLMAREAGKKARDIRQPLITVKGVHTGRGSWWEDIRTTSFFIKKKKTAWLLELKEREPAMRKGSEFVKDSLLAER